MELRGKADLRWVGLLIYTAELWTVGQEDLYQKDLMLSIKYHRKLDSSDIVERSVEEMIYVGVHADAANALRPKLAKIIPNVDEHTTINVVYRPKQGIVFYRNGQTLLGQIDSEIEGRNFLDIWLSPKTSQPKLRLKMLGIL